MDDQYTYHNRWCAVALRFVVVCIVFGMAPMYVHANATTTIDVDTGIAPILPTMSTIHTNDGLEQAVRTYFADIPVMIDIARCESQFRQYNPDGSVLHGGLGNDMIGLYQLYASIHATDALAMGDDINTPEGNMKYARYLYNDQGTDPWLSSRSCWGNSHIPEHSNSATDVHSRVILTKDLKIGMNDPEVQILQHILNSHGYSIAESGIGSLGNETTTYGTRTRDAVRTFQCKQGIVCSGDEHTTGYGYVGARTRSALLMLAARTATTSVVVASPHTTDRTTTTVSQGLSAPLHTATGDHAVAIAHLQQEMADVLKTFAQLQSTTTRELVTTSL
jgi:hypothetical protein